MFSYANSLSERLIGRTQSFISSAMVLVRKQERERKSGQKASLKEDGPGRGIEIGLGK